MKFLLAILALLLVEAVAFSDKGSTADETAASQQVDDAKKWNPEAKPAPVLELNKRRRIRCRRFRKFQVKRMLMNKARALRSLGVRLVSVPRRIRRKIRRFKKVTLRRHVRHRLRPSFEMCRERPAPVSLTLANYVNGDLAYQTQGVECAESLCNVRLSAGISLTLSGRCALRSTRIVVPVYNGCKFVPKHIFIGCSCKCRAYNPIG